MKKILIVFSEALLVAVFGLPLALMLGLAAGGAEWFNVFKEWLR